MIINESTKIYKKGDKVKFIIPDTLDQHMDGTVDHKASTKEINDAGWENCTEKDNFYVINTKYKGKDTKITVPANGIFESLAKKSNRGETYYEANVKTKDDAIKELNNLKHDLDDYINNDIYIDSDDGLSISLFWHEPSINLNYYPILQISYNHKTIFHNEGTENPNNWYKLIDDGISKIKSTR